MVHLDQTRQVELTSLLEPQYSNFPLNFPNDISPKRSHHVLSVTSQQMEQLEQSLRETARATLARFIRQIQPVACMKLTDEDVERYANIWLGQAVSWGITSVHLMCELFALRASWGPFDDADSAWVLAVLEGPLPETEKLGYLSEVMYGG